MKRPRLPWFVLFATLGAITVLIALPGSAAPTTAGSINTCPDDQGGQTTFTSSITHHTTQTHHTAPPVTVETQETRVTGVHNGITVYDQTISGAPASQAVQDAQAAARTPLGRPGGDLPSITGPALVESNRTLEESSTTETTEFNRFEETVTVTESIGPATIFIGDDQSVSCFIPAGTTNINDNTHVETFEDVTSTTTNTYLNSAHYELTSGSSTGTQRIWADVDCDGAVTTRDNQAELRFVLEQNPITQTEPCPDVIVDGVPRKWGDEDCDTSVTTRDNQSKLRFVLEQNPLTQTEPCPDVGSQVTVTVPS